MSEADDKKAAALAAVEAAKKALEEAQKAEQVIEAAAADMVAEGSPIQPETASEPVPEPVAEPQPEPEEKPTAEKHYVAVHGLSLEDDTRVEAGEPVPALNEETLNWLLEAGHIKESD